MSETPAPRTVYVSHAHADNDLADRYVAALRQRGLDIWNDRTNMQDGHFLSEQIATELERRTAFVVLLTPASVASFWVHLEMQSYLNLLAHAFSRLFLPVRVASCEVPTRLQAFKWIDAVSMGFDGAVGALALALGASVTLVASSSTAQPTESAEELVTMGEALIAQQNYSGAIPFVWSHCRNGSCSFGRSRKKCSGTAPTRRVVIRCATSVTCAS